MLQDCPPPNNHQLWRYMTAVRLSKSSYVSVKSVTSLLAMWRVNLWRDYSKPVDHWETKVTPNIGDPIYYIW